MEYYHTVPNTTERRQKPEICVNVVHAMKADYAEGKFAACEVTVYTHPAQRIPRLVIARQKEGAGVKRETVLFQSQAWWHEANAAGST